MYVSMLYSQTFLVSIFILCNIWVISSCYFILQYPDYFMLKLCSYIIACYNSFLTSSYCFIQARFLTWSYCLLMLGFSLVHDVLFRLGSEVLLKAGNGSIPRILSDPWREEGLIFSDDADAATDARLIRAARSFNLTWKSKFLI